MMNDLYITKEKLDEFKQELINLEAKRPLIAARINEAKELGDLSENAEYQEAKDDQAIIEGRILELEDMIRSAVLMTENNKEKDTVTVGGTVVITSNDGEKTYTIVGSQEADPLQGKISNESPIGSKLLGLKKGDKITVQLPRGDVEYTVKKIQ